MSGKRSTSAAAYTLIFTLIAAVLAAAIGAHAAPAACAGTAAPRAAVTGFFDALCSGDTQKADSFVCDYSGLGLDGETSSRFEQRLYDELTSSYSYSLSGELHAQPGSRSYIQAVDFTHLDLDRASADIDEVFRLALRDAETRFSFDELYDEDGGYAQTVIDLAVDNTADRIFADKGSLLVTESIDVEVRYSSGEWRVVVSERLADAILGGTEAKA